MGTNKTTRITRTKLSTVGTGLRSHIWINQDKFLSNHFSFVSNHLLKLSERPVVNPPVCRFSFSVFCSAFPDVSQVFHNKDISYPIDYLSANIVIEPSHITFLSSREGFKPSLSRLCAFGLEFSSQPLKLLDFSLMSFEELPFGSDCNVVYTQVNADRSNLRVTKVSRDFLGNNYIEEPLSFSFNQHSFLKFPIRIFKVIFGNVQRNIHSFGVGSDSDRFIGHLERSQSLVKQEWSRFNNRFASFQLFRRLSYLKSLSQSFDSKLRFKVELLPQSFVDMLMQFKLMLNVIMPSIITRKLNGFEIGVRNIFNMWQFSQRNFHCDSHIESKTEQVFICFGKEEERAFLPWLKPWVSCPKIL
jgi:hypothetical protein